MSENSYQYAKLLIPISGLYTDRLERSMYQRRIAMTLCRPRIVGLSGCV